MVLVGSLTGVVGDLGLEDVVTGCAILDECDG